MIFLFKNGWFLGSSSSFSRVVLGCPGKLVNVFFITLQVGYSLGLQPMDPNFQRDIQVGLKVGLKKKDIDFFFQISDPGYPDPAKPSWLPRRRSFETPYVWFRPCCSNNGHVPGWRGFNLKANSEKISTWTFASLRGWFFLIFNLPEIAEEHGDLVSWEPTHYIVSCFEKRHVELWHSDDPFWGLASWQVLVLMQEIRRKPTWDV